MERKDSWPACVVVCGERGRVFCVCLYLSAAPSLLTQQQPHPHRIPYLQLDLLAVNVDHPCPELHANGEVVHRLEPLVRELQQQAGLAHTCVCCVCESVGESVGV